MLLHQRKPTEHWIASTRASPAEINLLSHFTQCRSDQTWNTVFSFGPRHSKKVCGQAGEGPEEGDKDDQSNGKGDI